MTNSTFFGTVIAARVAQTDVYFFALHDDQGRPAPLSFKLHLEPISSLLTIGPIVLDGTPVLLNALPSGWTGVDPFTSPNFSIFVGATVVGSGTYSIGGP